jgi:hypothetical protein
VAGTVIKAYIYTAKPLRALWAYAIPSMMRNYAMPQEITHLDHPIDVMYLIHKAIRAEARRTRQAAEQLEIGGNFKTFMNAFYQWATALGYHEEAEYHYLIPHLSQSLPARHNQTGHKALLEGLEALQICLHEELGRTIVIPRTRRQLFGKVINLLIAQADLLEEEEDTLLPVIRRQMRPEQQLEIARRLLFDSDSEDARWMLDWMEQHLSEAERQALASLVMRFDELDADSPPEVATSASGSQLPPDVELESAALAVPAGFDHPIDVMVLLHKALDVDAWRAESIAEHLAVGETFEHFIEAFTSWMRALNFHADMEDAHMTPLLPNSPLARDNEAGHARLAQRAEDIQRHLQELKHQTVTTRTRRRLYGQVVALRIDQDDHFEEEVDLVLPLLREHLTMEQQLEVVAHLLHDANASGSEAGWVLDWLLHDLTGTERQALASLTAQLSEKTQIS